MMTNTKPRPYSGEIAERAAKTRPYSIRLTDAEIAELQRRGVRHGPDPLTRWLAKPSQR